ncbi:hypothetical protein VNO78_14684 [Psophocarpus tetragonolobus]|uniref:Uncharacterized protein n=1 Tax=Psophocarpus tetragonolobus TaxID=3891 RepID=A0AAN9SCS0_PSOTE
MSHDYCIFCKAQQWSCSTLADSVFHALRKYKLFLGPVNENERRQIGSIRCFELRMRQQAYEDEEVVTPPRTKGSSLVAQSLP